MLKRVTSYKNSHTETNIEFIKQHIIPIIIIIILIKFLNDKFKRFLPKIISNNLALYKY